jgi:hypothetical protein
LVVSRVLAEQLVPAERRVPGPVQEPEPVALPELVLEQVPELVQVLVLAV